ncbi:MAG: hypothetical protein R2795_13200 [Saprospiraceae bacterium]
MLRIIWAGMLFWVLSGCSSLLYSPSLNLTNQPIQEKQIDMQGGVELLPETRMLNATFPDNLQLGWSGGLRYGFGKQFNMGFKAWGEFSPRQTLLRGGGSIDAQFLRIISPQTRLILLPRVGIALNGNSIAGYGLSASAIYQREVSDHFSWYGGIGAVWGVKDFTQEQNIANELKMPMGAGVVGNLGIGWQLTNGLRANIELNPILQLNTFDNRQQFLLAPSVGVGYSIIR